MSVIKLRTQVGAGATTANILAGSVFEFVQRPSAIRVFAAQDAGDLAQLTFKLGNVVVGENLPINERTAGEGPSRTDDYLVGGAGMPGDRISIVLAETGGLVVAETRVLVEISEVA